MISVDIQPAFLHAFGQMEDIGAGPVGLDTAVFIYFIEEHPRFLRLVEPVFAALDAGRLEGVTDRELPSLPGLRILQLQDYVRPA